LHGKGGTEKVILINEYQVSNAKKPSQSDIYKATGHFSVRGFVSFVDPLL
jgi:hypothetical protein